MRFKTLAISAAVCGLGAFAADEAKSALVLRIQSGATTITVADATTPGQPDLNIAEGAIAFFSPPGTPGLGEYLFTLENATGFPVTGSPVVPVLTITAQGSSLVAPSAPLTVSVTQTGYTLFDTNFTLAATLLAPTGSGDVSVKYYLDTGDAPFGTTTLLGTNTFAPHTLAGAKLTYTGNGTPDGSSSFTQVITFSGLGAGTFFSTSSSITAVPEPTALALFGSALLALGTLRRRRPRA